MAGVDFAVVKAAVPLSEVLRLLGWSPTYKQGKRCRGWCPLHSSDPHGSRIFATNGDQWYCHKCKTGGDQLELYARVRGLTLYGAAIELCKRVCLPVPWLRGDAFHFRRPRNRKRNGRGEAGGVPPQPPL